MRVGLRMSDFKKYVIYISSNRLSSESALNTIKSAKEVGKIDVDLFDGCTKDESLELNQKHKFKLLDKKQLWNNLGYLESILGCFFSHFMLWNRCVDTNEKILILEHDTIFTSEFKDYDYEGVLNYGKPLWDSREKSSKFDFDMIHKERNRNGLFERTCECDLQYECFCHNYFLHGAHAYTITPKAAYNLIEKSKKVGIVPTDLHINRYNIKIADVNPFCSYQNQTFSLIQRRKKIQSWYDDKKFKCGDEAWSN